MQPHKEHRPRRHSPLPHATIVDVDPEDPSQSLDDSGGFQIEPLDVEAQPAAEPDEHGDEDTVRWRPADTGDLYGVHVSPAGDRDFGSPEELGENWIEALGQHAAEGGPIPEHEVTVIDDSDPHETHGPTDFRDRPKADRGSGGPGGL